ncbi:MAG: helix-turn-helix transcriptional regulator [Bacteroides sp.]|nr:helix-turn-helix transcriptional regulator [Bacteroides sp.]
MKFFGLVIMVFFMLLSVRCTSGSNSDALFDPNLKLSELLQVADSITEGGEIEKGLATYHYISKQAKFLAPDDTINAFAALNASLTETEIYFSKNSDYGNALNALIQAGKIVDRYSFPKIPVDFMLGVVYLTVGEQNNVDSYLDKSAEYFVNVLDNSCEKDSAYADYAVSNLILCSDRGKVKSISKDALNRYFSSSASSNNKDGYKFNMTLDSIMTYLHSHDHGRAMDIITRLSKSSRLPYHRVLPSIFFISGKISSDAGNYDEALNFYKESEKLVDPKHGQDMELQVYEALEEMYSRLGNEFMTGKYAEKANRLRREMTSFSQISSFKQAELAEEMDAMELNLTLEKEKSRNLLRWSISGLVVVVLAAIIIGMLLYFMKKLQEKNRVLYLRYVELLELSNSPRKSISEEEDSVKEICLEQEGGSTVNEECVTDEESYDNKDCCEREEAAVEAKSIETPKMDKPTAVKVERLFTEEVQRIEEVLSGSEELFSSDFSAAMLSVLTGIKPRLLSTIISEKYHTTFRNLINSRRVRAVCRRLETGTAYDNLTVDAIAESIGIKSRATFTSAFKRETGMTPAQYIQFAQERKTS